MNANELADEYTHNVIKWDEAQLFEWCSKSATMLRQQQAEIEKLQSWVEMLVEVPFFNDIDHYRGIPVAILRKAQEKC
jgi:hypothetical protein